KTQDWTVRGFERTRQLSRSVEEDKGRLEPGPIEFANECEKLRLRTSPAEIVDEEANADGPGSLVSPSACQGPVRRCEAKDALHLILASGSREHGRRTQHLEESDVSRRLGLEAEKLADSTTGCCPHATPRVVSSQEVSNSVR